MKILTIVCLSVFVVSLFFAQNLYSATGRNTTQERFIVVTKDFDLAKKVVTQANNDYETAITDVSLAVRMRDNVENKLRNVFDVSPEMLAAIKELKDAQDNYFTIKAPILDSLSNMEEYKKAVERREEVKLLLKEEKSADRPNQENITNLSEHLVKADSVVSKMETEVLDKNPKCIEAKTRVDIATAKIEELKMKFSLSIKDNPEIIEANTRKKISLDKKDDLQKARDVANTKLLEAKGKLEKIQRALEAERAAEDYARIEKERREQNQREKEQRDRERRERDQRNRRN
jgi:hypothetical protein